LRAEGGLSGDTGFCGGLASLVMAGTATCADAPPTIKIKMIDQRCFIIAALMRIPKNTHGASA